MSISLYDASVTSYLQTLGGVAGILAKGEEYADGGDLDLDQLVRFKLRDDMLSFSPPNFYFHATTTYDILRMHDVPLGKMDYLGAMRVGA